MTSFILGWIILTASVILLFESSKRMLDFSHIKLFSPFFVLGIYLCFLSAATFFGFYDSLFRYTWYCFALLLFILAFEIGGEL